MYGKLIDNQLYLAPRQVIYNGKRISNPRPEILLALGYKPVEYTDPPAPIEGYHPESSWVETDDAIVQIWQQVPDEEEVNEE